MEQKSTFTFSAKTIHSIFTRATRLDEQLAFIKVIFFGNAFISEVNTQPDNFHSTVHNGTSMISLKKRFTLAGFEPRSKTFSIVYLVNYFSEM
jgi:hypothetical protein